MKAILRSARITPKKANLIATMVRGKNVPEALEILVRVNKKGARIFQALIESAVANAEHNDAQDRKNLEIRTIVANKAQSFQRGVPIARGRWRPIRKLLSHLEVTLGVLVEKESKEEKEVKEAKESKNRLKASSQREVHDVQMRGSRKKSGDSPRKLSASSPRTS